MPCYVLSVKKIYDLEVGYLTEKNSPDVCAIVIYLFLKLLWLIFDVYYQRCVLSQTVTRTRKQFPILFHMFNSVDSYLLSESFLSYSFSTLFLLTKQNKTKLSGCFHSYHLQIHRWGKNPTMNCRRLCFWWTLESNGTLAKCSFLVVVFEQIIIG